MQEIFLHSVINFKGEQINMKYDYLVVGAGLYGAVFAHEAKKAGKSLAYLFLLHYTSCVIYYYFFYLHIVFSTL
jgi:hypothetical protein